MVTTDRVVIVGAGLGGLYAALALAPHPVLVISPETLGEGASSAWAQGGIAAAMAQGDTPQAHAQDTIVAGAGTVDAKIAELVTDAARSHILDLTAQGTPFDRDARGDYVLNHEAAHSTARVVRVKGDQAGRKIMETLIAVVRATPSVQVMERVVAQELVVTDGSVAGVTLARLDGDNVSKPVALHAPAVLLAGGGSGGLYALTTNPPRIRGQVMGLAARAGAKMADMEFVQFHPTAMDLGLDPAPLATEALRGAGARLINSEGEYFMASAHDLADLAPRDIVARAVFAQTQAGKRPSLDTRTAIGAAIHDRFPAVTEACRKAGLDPVAQPIPVAAAAHYHMGGVATDAQGRASLPGLWVCGEAASTGLHGANRLASNGVLEALVFARKAALDICDNLSSRDAPAAPVTLHFQSGGVPPQPDAVTALRHLMTDLVGVRRTGAGLQLALTRIKALEQANLGVPDFVNMCTTATLITAAALLRCESRGAHWRDDYPEPNPEKAQRSYLTFRDALHLRESVCTEAT
ncbi:L-aspartate oxidase [Roseinatronobacter bogoriensis]|uniref:L-aspartate oxidase n=1 Tax=Roseinatronobacter bogoriensis subsp. barguzinensis TaxID=441209 RepID=A0A2K8KL59_9RHOB|nr:MULTISPECIES: L-aspartate oxidase [Rhodobaca]ATX67200.1 L-aspartate oxidase [Rhodobaca barguzinensis]MBB4206738.1 L-aspartate oxidase [Rhodobaca bogoriensis DSM 18756]TDW41482.1 L-aspartate oxidase [Rhodobaca barguzinensis]TDY74340.1 L-aspartate oxidase [Rhodobaca bogoriensis DSM 18756]